MSQIIAQVAVGSATICSALAISLPITLVSDDPAKAWAVIEVGLFYMGLRIPSSAEYCSKLKTCSDTFGQCEQRLGASSEGSCEAKVGLTEIIRPETVSTPLDLGSSQGAAVAAQITGTAAAIATLGTFGSVFASGRYTTLALASLAAILGVATLLVWKYAVEPAIKPGSDETTNWNWDTMKDDKILENLLPVHFGKHWFDGKHPFLDKAISKMSERDGAAFWLLIVSIVLVVLGAGVRAMA